MGGLDATFHGDEALVTVEGPVDPDQRARVVTLVAALVAAGARHVVVDAARVRPGDPELVAELERQRRRVRALGGWMVVDGPLAAPDDDTPDDDSGELVEAFAIYRHTVGTGAASLV